MNAPNPNHPPLRSSTAALTASDLQLASDSELLAIYVATGQRSSIEAIVLRHGPMIEALTRRLLSRREDADDAFQATFLVLMRSCRTIRRRGSLAAWLYGVAYRVSCRLRQQRRKGPMPLEQDMEPSTGSAEDVLVRLCHQAQLDALDRELQALATPVREAIVEFHLCQRTASEIADQSQITVSAVEGRLRRGRAALRQRLAQRGFSFTAAAALASAAWRSSYAADLASAPSVWWRFLDPSPAAVQPSPVPADASAATAPAPLVPSSYPTWLSLAHGELTMPLHSFRIYSTFAATAVISVAWIGWQSSVGSTSIGPSADTTTQRGTLLLDQRTTSSIAADTAPDARFIQQASGAPSGPGGGAGSSGGGFGGGGADGGGFEGGAAGAGGGFAPGGPGLASDAGGPIGADAGGEFAYGRGGGAPGAATGGTPGSGGMPGGMGMGAGFGGGSYGGGEGPTVTFARPSGPAPDWMGSGAEWTQQQDRLRDGVRARLREPMELVVDGEPLRQVIDRIGQSTSLTLFIDPSLEASGLMDSSIHLKLPKMPIEDALHHLLSTQDADYVVEPTYVRITTVDDASVSVLRFYDTAHFLRDSRRLKEIAQLIEATVDSNWLSSGGNDCVMIYGSNLVIRCPDEAHRRIENLLMKLAKAEASLLPQ